ncbi:MAG: lipid-A-disaccharide synthase [Ignavibacteria bacterium]|nr:lipid-A-disaccharide synthase [Ignavibacteria bacterium]
MRLTNDENDKNKLLIIAGEESGDLIGAPLIRELMKLNPELEINGIGGDRMQNEGMNLIYHINDMAFLGFAEVVKHIPFIRKVRADMIAAVTDMNIKNVVLIDYPGFNLNIAKKLKKIGTRVIYYVSPQLWAWGSGRMNKIEHLVDKMLVVFPFEEKLYSDNNVDVSFVGHPLIERINNYEFLSREELFNKFQLDLSKGILLLMPGSRIQEVKKILPSTFNAARQLAEEFNLQTVIACSANLDENIFYQNYNSSDIKVIKGYSYDLMMYAKFGIIKSGTSTLEAGFFEIPMIVVYKTSAPTYMIGKILIRVNKIGMVNILLNESVVPELIQNDVTQVKIYKTGIEILGDKKSYASIKEKLSNVKSKLGTAGASARTAKHIYALMNEA